MTGNVAKIKECRRSDALGHVTILRVTQGYPGKAYIGPECAKPASKTAFSTGQWFTPSTVHFRDGAELAAIVRKVMVASDAILVRGNVLPTKQRAIRRLKQDHADGSPAAIGREPNAFLMVDLDHIPNLDAIDPRTDPGGAWTFLLSLLPPSMARAQYGYQWSSSMCVGSDQAPEQLNAHLYVAMDEALGEAGAKTFLQDVGAYVLGKLRARGHLIVAKYVDAKMAEPNQAYYVARPRFIDGAPDPFPGTRAFRIHDGGEPTLDVAAVGSEILEWLETQPTSPPALKASKKRAAPAQKAVAVPTGGAARIYSLDALRAARDAVACREEERIAVIGGRRPIKEAGFVSKAITGIYDLTYGRVESGAVDPRWEAWHREGGFPEGQRDALCNCLSSLIVESLPLSMSRTEVSSYVVALLSPLVCNGWLASEWIGCGYQGAVLDRYEAAASGARDAFGRDARYHYRRKGISAAFDPQDDEIATYGLNFGDDNIIRASVRANSGISKREDFIAAASIHDERIAFLIAQGKSRREVAKTLGLPRGTIIRAMQRPTMPALVAAAEGALAAAAETVVVALPVRVVQAPTAVAAPAVVVALPVRPRKPNLMGFGSAALASPSRIPLTG